tara:strand:- start:107 stop:364 length:258 start_codon:yes stop_codon:yes gene_type:complete
VKETAKHLANGAQNVTKKEYLSRMDICNSCVHFIHKDNTCGVCGCLMHIKAKWQTSQCPKDKWDKLDYKHEPPKKVYKWDVYEKN